jgi:mannose-6-phosphate isomerase-like protein (cupin superfamily)
MALHLNIEEETLVNPNYREVIYTDEHLQLVLMNLSPLQEIGLERHNGTQFIRCEKGRGVAIVDGISHLLKDNIAVVIPEGSLHNIVNTSRTDRLFIYTIYSPPQHLPNEINVEKPDED